MTCHDACQALTPAAGLTAPAEEHVSLHVSEAVRRGWVAQQGPNCAAAVVAGIVNALLPGGREDAAALRLTDGLALLGGVLSKRLDAQRARLARLLHGADLLPFEDALIERCASKSGVELGAPQSLLEVRELCAERASAEPASAFAALAEAWAAGEPGAEPPTCKLRPQEEGGTRGFACFSIWDVDAELRSFLRLLGGVRKLRRAERPSTAAVGNWALLQALEAWSAASLACGGPALRVSVLAAAHKGPPSNAPRVRPTAADSPAAAAAQFAAVLAAMREPDTVLAMHGRNHYALLFAARERSDGTQQELLTARKGQRPAHWVPWEELRAAMLRAPGHYAIFAASRVAASSSVS